MTEPLSRPTRKVPILLYEETAVYYERVFGNGWTGRVREILDRDVARRKREAEEKRNGLSPPR